DWHGRLTRKRSRRWNLPRLQRLPIHGVVVEVEPCRPVRECHDGRTDSLRRSGDDDVAGARDFENLLPKHRQFLTGIFPLGHGCDLALLLNPLARGAAALPETRDDEHDYSADHATDDDLNHSASVRDL